MPNTRNSLYKRGLRQISTKAERDTLATVKEPVSQSHLEKEGAGLADADGFSTDKAYSEEIEETGPEHQIISKMPTKEQRY
jgi:hypothetical protein